MPAGTSVRVRNGTTVMTVRVGRYGFEDAAGLAFDQIRRSAFTSG